MAAAPVLNIEKVKSSIRVDVSRAGSRNTPPKNGRKNRSMTRDEKPKSFRDYRNSYELVQFMRRTLNRLRGAGIYPR